MLQNTCTIKGFKPNIYSGFLIFLVMRKNFLIILATYLTFSLTCQETNDSFSIQNHRIVFYNVENFFDPYIDTTKAYNEFTSDGNLHWTYKKYEKKRFDIFKTLTAISEWKPLTVVALAEIENYLVLHELLTKTPLKYENYQIVHFESEDFRGIEIGVLYNADLFRLIYSEAINIVTKEDSSFKTRDIIYIKGMLETDTIHLFFNHWTSRYRGLLESNEYRYIAARTLKKAVDSIMAINNDANIVCMGDFNDNPSDESIQIIINTETGRLKQLTFHNMNKDVKGTLKYQSNWSYFDQAMVSESLTSENNRLYVSGNKTTIFDAQFLLEKDEKFLGVKPFRTNIGYRYNGGISDHLPIYVDIIQKRME
jgi:endonuclease/exonuclease/phosphatase family metal-dependent hydrolase